MSPVLPLGSAFTKQIVDDLIVCLHAAPSLRSLELVPIEGVGSARLTDAAFERLCLGLEDAECRMVETLRVPHNAVHGRGLEALAECYKHNGLLKCYDLDVSFNGVTRRGARALADVLLLPQTVLLRALRLSECDLRGAVGERVITALCGESQTVVSGESLTMLHGEGMTVGGEEVTVGREGMTVGGENATVVRGEGRTMLRTLDLQSTRLAPRQLQRLCRALEQGAFPALQELTLSHLPITGATAVALAAAIRSGALDTLVSLLLRHCRLHSTLPVLCRAVRDRPMQLLETLDVAENRLDAEAAQALAEVLTRDSLPSLRTVDCSSNPMGTDGLERLVRFSQCEAATALRLNACGIDDAGVTMLAKSIREEGWWPNLRDLQLKGRGGNGE